MKKVFGYLVIILFIYSCKPLNPSIMFKTPKDYQYDTPPKEQQTEYVIAANDILSFRLFTNNGFKLVNAANTEGGNPQQVQMLNQGITYLVEDDGRVNLPIIGRVQVAGKTLRDAEFFLEEKFNKVYVDPFIMLDITNRRVTVFPGNGGNGTVITLRNNNTTLLEALALAGGIREDGRANRVKLIRGDLSNPQVFLIDLSTIAGLRQSDVILQANDIIYVEPVGIRTRQVLAEISPFLSFAATLLTLYFIIERTN
ncbi:MAG: polysaccharide biosynthesis/export family protein [Vicingaceae bacterium]